LVRAIIVIIAAISSSARFAAARPRLWSMVAAIGASKKTLLAEFDRFCDDDPPVRLASLALPGRPGNRSNTEPPDRILYGNSPCNLP
jgi:hypothetical protein